MLVTHNQLPVTTRLFPENTYLLLVALMLSISQDLAPSDRGEAPIARGEAPSDLSLVIAPCTWTCYGLMYRLNGTDRLKTQSSGEKSSPSAQFQPRHRQAESQVHFLLREALIKCQGYGGP